MYFAAWSHNVILNTVNLSNDLKMGEYRESLPLCSCSHSRIALNKQSRSPLA